MQRRFRIERGGRFSLIMLVVLLMPLGAAAGTPAIGHRSPRLAEAGCADIAGLQSWEASVDFDWSAFGTWETSGARKYAYALRSASIRVKFERVGTGNSWRQKSIEGDVTLDERLDTRFDDYWSVGIAQATGALKTLSPNAFWLSFQPEQCTFSLEVHASTDGDGRLYDKFGIQMGPFPGNYPVGMVSLNYIPITTRDLTGGSLVLRGNDDLPVNTGSCSTGKCLELPYQVGIDALVEQFGLDAMPLGHVRWTLTGGDLAQPNLDLDAELLERSIFLDRVHVNDRFDANIDWGATDSGQVLWKVGDRPPERSTSGAHTVSREIDVGGLGPGEKTLVVQAQNELDQETEPSTSRIFVALLMDWCGGAPNVSGTKVGPSISYRCGFKWPEPAWEGTVRTPSWMPFLRGKPIGIKETQGIADLEVKSTGEGSLKGGAQSGFEAMGGAIIGSFSVKGDVLLEYSGVKIPSGTVEFAISGKLEQEEALIAAVPPFLTALTWLEAVHPPLAHWIASRAHIKLELEPKINIALNFMAGDNGLEWKGGEVTPGVSFKVTAQLQVVKDMIEARVGGGGEASITFKVPPPYFKQIDLKFTAFAAVVYFRFLLEYEKGWTWSSAGLAGSAPEVAAAPGEAPGWSLIDRDYLAAPDYATWTGIVTNTTGLSDQQLVRNAGPLAHPAFAARAAGSSQYLVWTHDKPGAAALSGGELAFAKGGTTGWPGSFVRLTDDNQDDLNPNLVALPNGKLLVVWERIDTATPPDFASDPSGYLSHTQIAAGTFSPAGTPTLSPLQLSSGGLNHRPQLEVLADGALAVWVNNPANQLMGTITNTDRLLFRRYNQATNVWSPALPAIDNLAGLLDFDLATAGGNAALVYARDMDADFRSENDRELFYVTFQNGAWSQPIRLTTNDVDDIQPNLSLSDSGTPLLVWKQGTGLRFLAGGWGATQTDLPFAASLTRDNWDLARGKDGSLALTWQEIAGHDTRIGYAFYDGRAAQWSDARFLVPPAGDHSASGQTAMISNVAPTLIAGEGGQDRLLLAYQLTDVQAVTRTVEGISMPNQPSLGATNLRVASVPLGADLQIMPGDVVATPDTARAGDPISVHACVHNSGQRSVIAGTVELLSGQIGEPPETVIASQPIANLAGGSTVTVTFDLVRPARADLAYTVRLHATTPSVDAEPLDNQALLGANFSVQTGPTLYAGDGATFSTLVTQRSGMPFGGTVPLVLTLDREDGPIVGRAETAFPVTPTATLQTKTWVPAQAIGAGHHQLFWHVDPGNTLGDPLRGDNDVATSVEVAADLTTTADDIQFGSEPGQSAPFSIWLRNAGVITSSATTLEVFDGMPSPSAITGGGQTPSTSAHLLATLEVPPIAPRASRRLTGELRLDGSPAATSGLKGIVVRVDPRNALNEITKNDNLVLAGGSLFDQAEQPSQTTLFLPLLRRGQ